MPSVRSNIIANLAGRWWAAIVHFAFVPVYISFVGVEGFGLIGFFVTLVAVTNALDLGLSVALNRELARRTAAVGMSANATRDLVRSFELVYWLIGMLIGGALFALSGVVAEDWLQTVAMTETTARSAIELMGLVLVVQWPLSLYQGGLRGLERQVGLNIVTVVMATIRAGGAALILWLVDGSITAFFAWQVVGALLHTVVLRLLLWKHLPDGAPPRFRVASLLSVRRFATGVFVISVLALAFTQIDKVLLSRLVDLNEFGYYSLAALISGGLTYLTLPVFEAVYPRFSALIAKGEDVRLATVYHLAAQVVSVLVLPVALFVALFAHELVWTWTGSTQTAAATDSLLVLLVVGSALNAVMNVPYALMLAYGWTRLPILLNLGAVVLLLPLLVVGTIRYGAVGAAAIWSLVNAGYLVVGVNSFHRRYLQGEKWRWFMTDVAFPALAGGAVIAIWRMTAPALDSRVLGGVWLTMGVALSVLAAALTTQWGRRSASAFLAGRGPIGPVRVRE